MSSTMSTVPRSDSWFSFGSRSSWLSVSTVITMPSSSIFSLKSPVVSTSPPPFSSVLHGEPRQVYLTCRHSCLVPVPPSNHPLCMDPSSRKPQPHATIVVPTRGRTCTRTEQTRIVKTAATPDVGLVQRVGCSVSSLVDMAAQFQRAYVRVAMFSMGRDPFAPSHSALRLAFRPGWGRASAAGTLGCAGSGVLKPEGYRATVPDIALFLPAPDADIPDGVHAWAHAMIPLVPDAPARPRVFHPPAPLPRPPFRLQVDPTHPRLRLVANPVLLRLMALQNMCAGLALRWEGCPHEGRMCEGKERLVGVSREGIGRSGLGWEVGVAC
ncbi:hypothetical protein WOLCODRAFT_167856 [Wolfiporia cocos MD-104 SS10]|uniref:Uncharacterized protein n=1 Tax=Wolfiporia cocos (strain MD-104) TaxID=742152 RepID=A0A2H3JAE0_WOLCO|nr:hypothetical protein WOLCODRAFT_167856 [Wolfiporia cocos MD-104 SS10]